MKRWVKYVEEAGSTWDWCTKYVLVTAIRHTLSTRIRRRYWRRPRITILSYRKKFQGHLFGWALASDIMREERWSEKIDEEIAREEAYCEYLEEAARQREYLKRTDPEAYEAQERLSAARYKMTAAKLASGATYAEAIAAVNAAYPYV